MKQLPNEITLEIVSYLDKLSFFSLARVNKKFLALSKHEKFNRNKNRWFKEYDEKKHARQLEQFTTLFHKCYEASDKKYYDGISNQGLKQLKLDYLAFRSFAEELQANNVSFVDPFLSSHALEIGYIEKDINFKKYSNPSWQELYEAEEKRQSEKCVIS